MRSLDSLFYPKSVALVGATESPGKLGAIVLANLIRLKGKVYPVNPNYREIMGLKAFPSIREVPGTVDLSVVLRPAVEIPEILRQHSGKAHIVLIVSAGFAEVGATGLQEEVARIVSSGIVSRSDVGGVRLGICNCGELQMVVDDLLRLKGAEGVLIEEIVPSGIEVIVGGTIDVEFGPIVMFGLGGLFVELFRDVSFALAPVTVEQANWLVNDTKGGRILKGFRGMPPVDADALRKIIVTVSELIGTGLLQEIDLNPVALYPTGAVVLDAKMKTN